MQHCAFKLQRTLTSSQQLVPVKSLKYTISAWATQSSPTALSAEEPFRRRFCTGVLRPILKQKLCYEPVAWHRRLSPLDSSVSSTVKWGGWMLDNFKVLKVPFSCNILWDHVLYYLFLFLSLKSFSNWLLYQCALQKLQTVVSMILRWLPASLSVTTSRDSMSKAGGKNKLWCLVAWED